MRHWVIYPQWRQAAHRAHTSITEVPRFFPESALAGFLLEKEVSNLKKFFDKKLSSSIAVIGGSKVSSKIDVLFSLLDCVDKIIIGGGGGGGQ